MKAIKYFMMAAVALFAATTFTSCGDDDDNVIDPTPQTNNQGQNTNPVVVSNMERYQQEVDATVKAEKKHNKVILLVAFGSTWQQAYDAFDLTRAEYKEEFPEYDVFLSFSSAICINRAMAAENTDARSFYEPKYWLEAFGRVQYQEIIVQSMQVIPGEEFSRVVNAIKDFANNSNGDLDDDYMAKFAFEDGNPGENKLRLGMPLMYTGWASNVDYNADPSLDVNKLAEALHVNFSGYASEGAVLFMGHGNPDEYDTYKANIRYTQLETALQKKSTNYYVGTVDMKENFKVQVLDRMKANSFLSGKVFCAPLMSIAGDHAHNDMAGDDDAWDEETQSFVVNDEGEVEDTSWKMYFSHNNYIIEDATYKDEGNRALVKGLLEYANVRELYKTHTRNAEFLDYYHSRLPEE